MNEEIKRLLAGYREINDILMKVYNAPDCDQTFYQLRLAVQLSKIVQDALKNEG